MVRPARPRLCLQELWEHQVVTRQHIRRRVSYCTVRRRARSTTAQTFGNVKELSAMLLARTMWVQSFGTSLNTSSCSCRGIIECRAKTRSLGQSARLATEKPRAPISRASSRGAKFSNKDVMSAMPGRKTMIVQPGFASCCTRLQVTSMRPSEICGSTLLKPVSEPAPDLALPLPFPLPFRLAKAWSEFSRLRPSRGSEKSN
mmetsp:Transcript_78735/g.188931  ORF Transcript_78735/g.188931 Transcript_78735/m.188931 type:complete len:202 (-) Transcript_78735:807-1412(-)